MYEYVLPFSLYYIKVLHAYADRSGFNVGRALARHFDGINADL